MALLGTAALILALGVALGTALVGSIAGRTGLVRHVELSRLGIYLLYGLVGVASCALAYSFLTHDFALRYVQRYSDSRMPLAYTLAAFWGGQQGSLLFWVFVMMTFGTAATWVNRYRASRLMPYFHASLAGVAACFLAVLVFVTPPFESFFILDPPTDGTGLNPLLQNPLMVIHPPCLLSGYSSFAVPFAFGMAALLSGQLDDEWLKLARRWTLISWLFLSVGNVLGGMWAYQELGWGGYWAWDAVENASFIPWLTATAFLHSAIVQEKRGMLHRWNIVLVMLTFLLTLFGTFLTRSGLIDSVHTFAESEVGDYFFAIFVFAAVVSALATAYRWRALRSSQRLESPISREAIFLLNNWLLVVGAFIVLWGTMFPRIREMIDGVRISIGPPWFNEMMTVPGLLLLILVAVGTILPWRRASLRHFRRNFAWTVVATAIGTPVVVAVYWYARGRDLGVSPDPLHAGYAITAVVGILFVFTTTGVEFQRAISARMKSGDADPLGALIGVVSRHRRRYGGYIVHLGIALMYLAFLGNVVKVEKDTTLRVGERVTLGDYEVRYDRFRPEYHRDKVALYADMTLFHDGEQVGTLAPARFDFTDYGQSADGQPNPEKMTTEIYIHSTPLEDVYVALVNFGDAGQAASFKMVVSPFTWWLWMGALVLFVGGMICLWPEEPLGRDVSPGRWMARGGGIFGVMFLLALPVVALLQMSPANAQSAPPLPEDTQLEGHAHDVAHRTFQLVMTRCDGCAGKTLAQTSPGCYQSELDRREIRRLAGEGHDQDEILRAIAAVRGESALAIPPPRGANNLSWALPLAGAAVVLPLLVVFVRRRSQKPSVQQQPDTGSIATDGVDDEDPYLKRFRDELGALDA